jgi:hypothetical protein
LTRAAGEDLRQRATPAAGDRSTALPPMMAA